MAKSIAQIEAQMAKLQKQKEAMEAKEVRGVIERIKVAIEHYGLSAQDLFGRSPKVRKVERKTQPGPRSAAGKSGGRKGFRVPVKYRDDTGNTWTGRGNRPRWLAAALAEGKKLEDFAVKG